MKILRIIGSSDPRGGGPIEGILRSSEAMAALGHVNEVACLDRPDDPWVAQMPLRVHALGAWTRRYGYSPQFVPWLRERSSAYDAFILHGVWNYSSVGAHRALAGGPKPYFVFPHGMLDPWFLRAQPVKGVAKRLYWSLFERVVLRDAAAVLFTSEEERRLARAAYGDGYEERVVAYGAADAPSGPAAQTRAFRKAAPNLGARPYLLFLSRLHPKKGCDLLLDAFATMAAQSPDLDLVMAGPDQIGWGARLQKRAADLGIGARVHWPGMLSGPAKWGAFRGAQAFVLPSHQENFGIVVAEAMACGLPVLITSKVNIWADIQASGAGLVEEDDAVGVAALLRRFLALSPPQRRQMGLAARRCFQQHFGIARSARDILAVIEDKTR